MFLNIKKVYLKKYSIFRYYNLNDFFFHELVFQKYKEHLNENKTFEKIR